MMSSIMIIAKRHGLSLATLNAYAQGDPVQEAHTKVCATVGHGIWKRDGEELPQCSRCGAIRPDYKEIPWFEGPEADAIRAELLREKIERDIEEDRYAEEDQW